MGAYLLDLSKKPKALKYTNFFTGLPSHLQTYFEKSDLSATKRVLQEVVKQVETYDYERVIGSLDQAVARYGDDTDDMISAFYFHLHPPLDMGTVKNPVPHVLE
ncbi:hypothetical protein D3H64_02870 [Atopobacter sp. AH10]|uniref:hypothetical protein n=1 Tax=Atopobacter sp. AH10 TaxID=2315861 RepID=UPI000EF24EBA|nr:hypothetical protein [Atopobacter sp. AH10]RLK63761.1 hypothetical protein D3H64_02870 [Atopobacter sp. AH10]